MSDVVKYAGREIVGLLHVGQDIVWHRADSAPRARVLALSDAGVTLKVEGWAGTTWEAFANIRISIPEGQEHKAPRATGPVETFEKFAATLAEKKGLPFWTMRDALKTHGISAPQSLPDATLWAVTETADRYARSV